MKRLVSALLCLCILLTLLPVSAMAAETVSSGSCGDNLTWELDSDGTLTISGTGEMKDCYHGDEAPWMTERTKIKRVVIKSGITSIGGCICKMKVDTHKSVGVYFFRSIMNMERK